MFGMIHVFMFLIPLLLLTAVPISKKLHMSYSFVYSRKEWGDFFHIIITVCYELFFYSFSFTDEITVSC